MTSPSDEINKEPADQQAKKTFKNWFAEKQNNTRFRSTAIWAAVSVAILGLSFASYKNVVEHQNAQLLEREADKSTIASMKKSLEAYESEIIPVDQASTKISQKFFGGKAIEYIEPISGSNMYAVIVSASDDVYYINHQLNTIIKGTALFVPSTPNSAVLPLNKAIINNYKNHKSKPVEPSVDVTNLLSGQPTAAVEQHEPKKAPEATSATPDQSDGKDTQDAVNDASDEKAASSVTAETLTDATAKQAAPVAAPESEASTTAVSAAGETREGSDVVAPNNPSDLDKLANGEATIPLREPTKEEEAQFAEATERDGAKSLFGSTLKDNYLVVYNPPKDVKTVATINVFSDPECPSCQMLHRDMQKFLDLGIKVRYIAMPRKGLDSSIAKQMAVAFCSPDRAEVFSSLYSKKRYDTNIENYDACFSLVSKNANLGYSLGVKSTPTIYSSDTGASFVGYPRGENAYLDVINKLDITSLIGKS